MRLNNDTETCETRQAQMLTLLDNELTPAEAADLRSHFALCPTCAPIFEQTQKALRSADTWKVEGTDIWSLLEKRLALGQSKQTPVSTTVSIGTSRFSELLQKKKVITAEELAEALYTAQNTGRDLAKIIIELGYATERDVIESKAQAEGLQFIDLTKHKPEPSAVNVVPAHIARKHNALPVKKDGTRLWVAMVDPRNIVAVDDIRMVSRCQVVPLAAVPSDLEKAITEAHPAEATTDIAGEQAESVDDLRAVLTEMRALRAEIQELRGEVGTLRRLLSATQNAKPVAPRRPLSPTPMMPLALPENTGIGLL